MTRALLTEVGRALYGERWQTPLAADLHVCDRTMRRWASTQEPPSSVLTDLRRVAEERRDQLDDIILTLGDADD